MTDVVFDLFGMAVRQRGAGRGRPEHVWTVENSNKISLLFACGHDVADAAAALGLSQPTLRKHYFSEVDGRRSAALRFTALQLYRLDQQAADGNVAAEKTLTGMVERERTKALSDRLASRQTATPAARAKPLGKKEEAQVAARGISGLFAVPAAPQLGSQTLN